MVVKFDLGFLSKYETYATTSSLSAPNYMRINLLYVIKSLKEIQFPEAR